MKWIAISVYLVGIPALGVRTLHCILRFSSCNPKISREVIVHTTQLILRNMLPQVDLPLVLLISFSSLSASVMNELPTTLGPKLSLQISYNVLKSSNCLMCPCFDNLRLNSPLNHQMPKRKVHITCMVGLHMPWNFARPQR